MDRQAQILIVDDNEENRDVLQQRMERMGHQTELAVNGVEALACVRRRPYDLILLDINMPEMNGHEVLSHLKSDSVLMHYPVIMVSANDDDENIVRALQHGAEDYITKPFRGIILKARVSACLERKWLRDQQIASAQLATIFALSKLAESRDPETGEHLERMREYSRILACYLAREDRYAAIIHDRYINDIYAAAPLHDIGKVGVPDHILQKPGKLTDEEFAIMQTHTVVGAKTLKAVNEQHPGNDFIRLGIEIAESHHEKWDGSGYPHGLAGEHIPLVGRITALGDVYDALTSRRCYKEPMPPEKAKEIILAGSGKHFAPDVVACFLAAEGEFLEVRKRFQGQ